ncbi:hypothetical protein [Thermocrispum municipale]|jgi:hypothetical protein|uniref:hypothetical protein n=1 Tax=Thermocrispum municipale TaxID=37926 RepID=UPI000410BAD2|nr:hypothetical protein [Thermocrispum municipale]
MAEKNEVSAKDRQQARNALTRGQRSEPGVDAKLKTWRCKDQAELWTRQDLRADRRPAAEQ